MSTQDSVDEVLDFAIRNEEEAAAFYLDLAGRMDRAGMRQVFEEFARACLRRAAGQVRLQMARNPF